MEQFKIRQEGFKEIRKALFIKRGPIILLIIGGVLGMHYYTAEDKQAEMHAWPFIIPIMLGVLAFALNLAVKRAKALFESYHLTIDNNEITREQLNTPTITISKADVNSIIKNPNGSFTINGNSAINVIGVPAQINDYEKLEKLLAEIRQIDTKTGITFFKKFQGLLFILGMALFAAVYISYNKIIVGTCGTVLLVIIGYSFFEIIRSKNIDSQTKKSMFWLLLVAVSTFAFMYSKITGHPVFS